jgi:N-carbamoylputrescine amidase
LKVTVCEMNDDREAFARDWKALAEHVGRESSELVLLPEMPFHRWFCAAPSFDPVVWKEAVEEHRRWTDRIGELGAPVVLGSRPVELGGRRLNEGFVWTRKGGAKGVHLKSYLPDEEGYFEASWYGRGDRDFSAFEVGGWKAGLMICSDVWALQHARGYGKAGAHLVAVPYAGPRSSTEKWVACGRVVAVVSGAFCIASNRKGSGGGVNFGGSGWVIDPDGRVLGLTSGEKPFVTVDLDMRQAERAKKTYPRDALEPD